MSKVICGVAISVDGYVAGEGMTEKKPFGHIPTRLLHHWMFDKQERRKNKAEIAQLTDAGAFIMGRNMFGPAGPTYDKTWKGWWGEDPPYHAPVFVLTHRAHGPLVMKGGTTFNFVTDGIESALRQARKAAGNKAVAVAGGANVINQYLAAGLIDELWLHIVPVTIGKGARLFENVPGLQMELLECRGTKMVTHIKYRLRHQKTKV